jgi:two-component system response regulator HydG
VGDKPIVQGGRAHHRGDQPGLHRAIAEKRFRQDLYYRLNVARFVLPPLRERARTSPSWSSTSSTRSTPQDAQQARLGDGVLDYLVAYDYPGNIRELENMIEQGVALASQTGVVQLEDIAPQRPALGPARPGSWRSLAGLERRRGGAQRHRGRAAEFEGNRERAAELLGLSPTTLWRKMKRLNILWPRWSKPSVDTSGTSRPGSGANCGDGCSRPAWRVSPGSRC